MDAKFAEIVLQAHLVPRGGSQKNVFNVFHYVRNDIILSRTHAAVNTIFQSQVVAPLVLAMNVDFVTDFVTVRWIDDATNSPDAYVCTNVGAITGDREPDFVAAVMQLKTGLKGKSGRGSKHFSGIAESSTTGDALTTGAQTLFTTAMNAILANMTDSIGNVWTPIIISRKTAVMKTNPTFFLYNAVTSGVLNSRLGTMKRRKAKA